MARVKDKKLFSFLKDRKIFTEDGAGKGGLKEALSRMEQKTMYNDAARKGHKKATKK